MQPPPCRVLALFVGGPKTLVDARGEWRSSIARDRVDGRVELDARGFVGDQATQPYHGSPEAAVCLHAQRHYDHWNETLGMTMRPGGVGENLTLDSWDDADLCVGDLLRIGTALLQVSMPRIPCESQARFVGRPDWVRLTITALRTGAYARVLEPGALAAGDELELVDRPSPGLSIHALNACWYHSFDAAAALRFADAQGLQDWWRQRLRDRVEKEAEGRAGTP